MKGSCPYHERKIVLSYRVKHLLAPNRLLTAKILASVESTICRESLPAEEKETVRAKVASTFQTSQKPVSNLTKENVTFRPIKVV